MIKEKEVQNFLTNFQTELPENFTTFAEMLQDLQEGRCQAEDLYQHARELLRPNLSLINYFNKFILPTKQIQVLTKSQKEQMIDHLLKNVYSVNPELEKKLSKISIEIGKQKFDDINFYSYEDLSSQYISALQETKYLECIGRSEFKIIKSILHDFVNNSVYHEGQLIQQYDQQNGSYQHMNTNGLNHQVVISKEDFRKENQLLDLIEHILIPEEFEIFLKLFWIYHLNIISYVEFVKTIENILINLDKQTCLALKNAIECREQNRAQKNPFNLKNQLQTIDHESVNQSYKKIEGKGLQYTVNTQAVVNKQYACIPRGHEAFTPEDQASKNQIKNTSEEELLKVEDEMHEFDVILTQFRVVKKFVNQLQTQNLTEQKKNKILRKISNINLFGYLYGKKAFQIFDIIRENPDEILPILIQRIDERVDMLIKVREDYSKNNWQKQMAIAYYKALDIKANTTKILERKKLINKNLIKELNDQQVINNKHNTKVNVVNSVKKLLYKKKENLIELNQEGNFWNPSIVFEIGNKDIMKDICAILQIYGQFIKVNNAQEYQKCQEIIKFFIENFFDVFQSTQESEQSLKDYFKNLDLENHEGLLEECFSIEQYVDQHSKMQFLYSEKLSPKINSNKIPDMLQTIKELLNDPRECLIKPSNTLKPVVQDNNNPKMNIQQDKNDKPYNIIFGSYQFYILYRYFVFLYERFQFANSHSESLFKSDRLYKYIWCVRYLEL